MIKRVHFQDFDDLLYVMLPHHAVRFDLGEVCNHLGVRRLDTLVEPKHSYPGFCLQCETLRVATRLQSKYPLTKMGEGSFSALLPAIDFSRFDIGPSLVMVTPPWHEYRPWLEANLTGDVSVTIGVGGLKRFSFESPDDYVLMKLSHF